MKPLLLRTLGCALLLRAANAAAQTTGDATVAAEDLFQRGKDAMRTGDFATACPLLAESYRIDPAGGTLQNLAVCYESTGKTASAYARFFELKTMSAKENPPRADRIALAEMHAAQLAPRLSRVVIDLDAKSRAAKPKLTIDAVEYGEASWKAGILVDPGKHEVDVDANGKKPFHTVFEVQGEHRTEHVSIALEDAPVVASPTTSGSAPRRGSGLKLAGIVTLGAGAVVLVGGGVFGILAATTNASANDVCESAPGTCSEAIATQANGKRDDARAFANVSNVLVPVGAVAAITGGILLWRGIAAGRSSSASVQFAPTWGGLAARGTFQ